MSHLFKKKLSCHRKIGIIPTPTVEKSGCWNYVFVDWTFSCRASSFFGTILADFLVDFDWIFFHFAFFEAFLRFFLRLFKVVFLVHFALVLMIFNHMKIFKFLGIFYEPRTNKSLILKANKKAVVTIKVRKFA